MKSIYSLLFVQLLFFVSAFSQDYHFFYFVQLWPGSYCDTEKSCCYPTTGKPKADFGIHGLWPSYYDGSYPSDCDSNTPFDRSQITNLLERMKAEWPTLACPSNDGIYFWTNEWIKHGTCSENQLDQHSYFQAALVLKNQTNLLRALTDSGIVPNGEYYSTETIKDAIKQSVGYTPFIRCNIDTSGKNQLYQVYLCVDYDGSSLMECPTLPHGKCDSQIVFPTF